MLLEDWGLDELELLEFGELELMLLSELDEEELGLLLEDLGLLLEEDFGLLEEFEDLPLPASARRILPPDDEFCCVLEDDGLIELDELLESG